MARPGFFFIDTHGLIREKFFEARYRERLSGNNLIAKLFPELGEEVTDYIEAPHIQLAVTQSDRIAFPANRITLTAEVRLPSDVHVYAPGTKGYKPASLTLEPVPGAQVKSSVYSRSKILNLPAINERVPVFEGTFRIREELQVATAAEFSSALPTEGKTLEIKGKFEYQACDSKICFVPSSVPVRWQLQVLPLDRQRAPEDIQHK